MDFLRLDNRTNKAAVGSVSILVGRFFSLLIGLVLTGVIARYFSAEEFGLWGILTFLIGLIPVLDGGIGLALRNKLSVLYSYNKDVNCKESETYFYSAFYVYIYLTIILVIFLYIVGYIIPWGTLFNTNDIQIIENGSFSFILSLIILLISLPFAVSTAGFYSYQETHWNSFFDLTKSILAILLVSFLIIYHAGFVVIVSFFSIAMLVPVIIAFFVFIKKRDWKFRFVNVKITLIKIKELMPKSIQFGLMQLSSALMFSVQVLIVGKVVGLKEAGEYALVQKLFLILNVVHFAVLTPLWSAYTESIASKDIIWVKKALTYSIVFTVLLFSVGSTCLYFFAKPIIFMWTGKIITNTLLYVVMGIWVFTTGWVSCYSVFLNGIEQLKMQTILIVPSAILYIPLANFLGVKFGVFGVCLAGTIVLIPLAISNPIQSIINVKRLIQIAKY